jgi:hypothetical protein
MRFRSWRNLSDEYRRAVEGHTPWARGARDPQAVVVADVETDPAMAAFRPLFQRERIGAVVFVPLLAAGRLVGRIRLEQATAGRPHLVEQSTVGIVGNRLFYQTRDSLISYRLLRSEGDEVIFESAGRARPRRIAFRRDGRFLRVMHINRDGRSESWTYQRSGARSAAPYCSGSYRRIEAH